MTLVYATPLILREIFVRAKCLVQNPLFYTTRTLDNATSRIFIFHIKEAVNAKKDFYVCYVHLKYIPL